MNKEENNNFPEIVIIKRLLPIGTVVKIKDDKNKKFMIVSNIMNYDDNGKPVAYEYMACLYPFGYVDEKSFWFFNEENITDIYQLGYLDDKEYLKKIITQSVASGKRVHIEG